jgi:hypothetical protein
LELLDDAANETHGRTMAEPPTPDKDGLGSLRETKNPRLQVF